MVLVINASAWKISVVLDNGIDSFSGLYCAKMLSGAGIFLQSVFSLSQGWHHFREKKA